MSKEIRMGGAVVAPFKVKEGTITITTVNTAFGDEKAPVLSAPVNKDDLVEIDSEMTVKPLNSGIAIGYVYNNPKWEKEPLQNYTQAQAVSADMLREAGIQTFFKQIRTVDAKASEGIAPGDYVTLKQEVEKSESATNAIALSAQDTNDRVVIGIL